MGTTPINVESRLDDKRDTTLSRFDAGTKPANHPKVKYPHHETRRNYASCFLMQGKFGPFYTGIIVFEEALQAGVKYAVIAEARIVQRGKRTGEKYVSVRIKPFQKADRGGAK